MLTPQALIGGLMEFEDEWEDTLVCPACGHSVDLEHYGMENDEEYDALYPVSYTHLRRREVTKCSHEEPD